MIAWPFTTPLTCPGCATRIDSCYHAGSLSPEVGDVSICLTCSQISLYAVEDDHLALRVPADDELLALFRDPEIIQAIATVRITRENRHR